MENYLIMDTVFLLRDSGEIFGTYRTLEHAYNSLLQLVYARYKYHKHDTIATCDIDQMINAFQIYEYYNNVVKDIYSIESDCYIYDSKKKMHPIDTISIGDYIMKINNFRKDEEFACNSMEIFLPVGETEKTCMYSDANDANNVKVSEIIKKNPIENTKPTVTTNPVPVPNTIGSASKNEIRELEALMKTLELKKNAEIIKKKIVEKEIADDIENEIKKKVIINSDIHDLEQDKRLYAEKRTKFNVDYGVFLQIEKEMINKERMQDVVPEIFQRSYNVFKKMRENNIIGRPEKEMFEYFMENLDKIDFYGGNHNMLFDAPTLEELKNFCPSDDDYETDSDDSCSDTENMINHVLGTNRNLDEIMESSESGSDSIASSEDLDGMGSDSESDEDAESDEDDEKEKELNEIRNTMHSLMTTMSKPLLD